MLAESQPWTRDLHSILSMQGGDGDGSYEKNSQGQASAVVLCKPILAEAIRSIKLFEDEASIKIADLGCATGQNTLSTVEFVNGSLRRRYEKEGGPVPEFEAYLCDLPSNDFNSLFKLHLAHSDQAEKGYYVAGVPGSFYYRLFPKGKLHVAVSLSALHWLSQIPKSVVDKQSPAWNKGCAWIHGARKEVVDAFAKQSEEDMMAFLKSREEEIVPGGILFMLMAGRPDSQPAENQIGDPPSMAKHPFTNTMDQAWQALLDEGLIDEETRDTFNIPSYMRSIDEVKTAFNNCKSFELIHIEFHKLLLHLEYKQQEWIKDHASYGRAKANLIRSALKPVIEAHLGEDLSEELFKRYEKYSSDDITKLRNTCYNGVITVCAIRK